jgi:hypothetical protein
MKNKLLTFTVFYTTDYGIGVFDVKAENLEKAKNKLSDRIKKRLLNILCNETFLEPLI